MKDFVPHLSLAVFAAAAVGLVAVPAAAQPAPAPRAPGAAPAPPARSLAPSAPPAANDPASSIPDMMAAVPGGITSDQVGARAAATSYQAKAAEETAAAAAARVDGAKANYLPRLGLTGRYTRLSEFTPPAFGGGGSLVATGQPSGTPVTSFGTPTGPTLFSAPPFSFPLVFNQWLTQATIAIPISDYFLRINEAYTATTHQEEAARFDVATARAKSLSDGKIAYYTWLRARGAVTVADQTVAVARAHLKDSENQFAVGNASKADVLRAQTQVSAAELLLVRAKNGVIITEAQVRVATHAKEEEKLEPGESLDTAAPAPPDNPKGLVREAISARPEIKSIDRNAEATRKLAGVSSAGKYPVLSGFGDITYANPNPRRIPATQDWFATWSAGAQITWSPNDLAAANPAAADLEARAAALDAQKYVIRDGIELEVTQAYQGVLEADAALVTTVRQLESAEEGYRVARELFNAGRGTATTLIDAENALTQTRVDRLNAKVDARLARVRLDHALGRDVKQP